MSSDDAQTTGVFGVTLGGIQDVSALLPLLGTEQCEELVSLALQHGRWYAAAASMSLFGSLGIVKAGFMVLGGSISYGIFHGPTLLRNAGFKHQGVAELLTDTAGGNRRRSLAEEKILRHLSQKTILSVSIDFWSMDFWTWNVLLFSQTFFLSSLGLLPYVYLIVPEQQFRKTWLYPIMRTLGCTLVSVTIQYVLQLRILEGAYSRVRFLATDRYLKDRGIQLPSFWDPNERSSKVLEKLHKAVGPSLDRGDTQPVVLDNGVTAFTFPRREEAVCCLQGLDVRKFPPFDFTPPTTDSSAASQNSHPTMRSQQSPPHVELRMPASSDLNAEEKGKKGDMRVKRRCACCGSCAFRWLERLAVLATHSTVSITLHVALLFGMALSVVGYIGSFSVVQASPRGNSKGAVVWLVGETLLAVARMSFWARNPPWDDPKYPIALEKVVELPKTKSTDDVKPQPKISSYGVAWTLDSVTAEDVHALIISIDGSGCAADTQSMVDFLQETILVPKSQIVILDNADATKEKIVEELRSLGEKPSVTEDAPIIVFFATHCFVERSTNRSYIIPYPEEGKRIDLEGMLAYDEIVEIFKTVSHQGSNNITLILDTCQVPESSVFEGRSPFQTLPCQETVPVQVEGEEGKGRMPEAMRTTVSKQQARHEAEAFSAEMFEGQPSHVILAGIGTKHELVKNRPKQRSLFTQYLANVLMKTATAEPGRRSIQELRWKRFSRLIGWRRTPLVEMVVTYKELVDKINSEFNTDAKELVMHPRAMCSTMYEHRSLFDGLFTRKVNQASSTPLITVRYSDL